MARIEPVQEPYTEKFAAWLAKTMPPGVPPLTLFTTLARDERLFERFLGGSLLDRGHLAQGPRAAQGVCGASDHAQRVEQAADADG